MIDTQDILTTPYPIGSQHKEPDWPKQFVPAPIWWNPWTWRFAGPYYLQQLIINRMAAEAPKGFEFEIAIDPNPCGLCPYYVKYHCKTCKGILTEGPSGGAAVNSVCDKCRINYGCLPNARFD